MSALVGDASLVADSGLRTTTVIPPSDPRIKYTGRTRLFPRNHGDDEHVAYDFNMVTVAATVDISALDGLSDGAAISAKFRFQCESTKSAPGRQGNLIQIVVDGAPFQPNPLIDSGIPSDQSKCNTVISIPLLSSSQLSAQQLSASNLTLALVKITEPDFNNEDLPPGVDNAVRFYGFELSSTSAASKFELMRFPEESSAVRFQIVGDSITAGYQIMCPPDNRTMNAIYTMENVSATYSGRTCAAFGAECHVEAWSGRGVVRNVIDGIGVTMAVIDTRTQGALHCPAGVCNNTWAYPSTWVPTAVLYNLGTNDFARGTVPANFTEGVVGMIVAIAGKYAPATPLFVLQCGPMAYTYCPNLVEAQSTLAKRIPNPVHVYEHPHIVNSTNECSGHPSSEISVTLASAFVTYLKGIMLI